MTTQSASMSVTTGFAEVNGAKLYYEVMGEGQPLVMIHAGIADRRMWDDQVNLFAQHYRVIRYDVRGFGYSRTSQSASNTPKTYADHQDLYELLDFLNVDQALLLGVSNGGRVALDFTLVYPQRVRALVLVAPGLGGYEYSDEATEQKDAASDAALARGDITQAIELTLELWVDGPHRTAGQVNPAVRQRVREMMVELCQQPEDRGERQELEPPAISRLAEIRVSTLVLVGDQDVPDMLLIADLVAAGIREARKVVMLGVAHLPNMENPQEFNQYVLDFLSNQ